MKGQPILLDLCCCEGIGARGYREAGLRVIGVDVLGKFRKRYPGEFVQADAMLVLGRLIAGLPIPGTRIGAEEIDAVHASWPCQGYTVATLGNPEARARHPRLIAPGRELLEELGLPYIIENVEQARSELRDPQLLCGRMFGLEATDDDGTQLVLDRHRLFETSWGYRAPVHEKHDPTLRVGGVYGGGRSDRREAREIRRGGYTPKKNVRAALIGVPPDAHTMHGLNQSIPPAYTRHIGTALRDVIA